jgi:hypothetical protein
MRILIALLVVVLVIGGYLVYQRHEASISFGNGTVTSHDSADSSNTNLDGAPVTDNSPTQGVGSGRSTNQPPPETTAQTIAQPNTGMTAAYPTTASPAAVPPGDSQSANAPDRLAFGGSGRYQWYRQGDLTWRVDTTSGATCVAFATMEQWHVRDVYTHGCGNRA